MTIKFETVCILRSGFNFLHTEGADFAAKVTSHQYEPGKVFVPERDVLQEMLIPRFGVWG